MGLSFVEQMPRIPKAKPLDWGLIADRFDAYVMNPENKIKFTDDKNLIRFGAFYEDGGHELITFGGIVLGKLLRGENISDFLPSLADYFNEDSGIFFNHPNNTREEYWYLMYVNCLAFEIIRNSLNAEKDHMKMIKRSLLTLKEIAYKNKYNFNDQGWNFKEGQPFTRKDSYRQPDTIGAYSYLMLVGYEIFAEEQFLQESVKAMNLYEAFEHNPWYEIPSGAMACLAAAKLNGLGYSFDLNKILHFALDAKEGCLQVGTWGEKEVNGLMMGWRGYSREEAEKTAYSLESLLLLPFLLPVATYDHRFANLIGKYAVHISANARNFFADCISLEAQSRPELPPDVPYETLHVNKDGHSPYAFGDFHSHKSVYGGALTLWFASIVEQTNEEYILKLNVTKTNFGQEKNGENYLLYNPYDDERTISYTLGEGQWRLCDEASDEVLYENVSGTVQIVLPKQKARLLKVEKVY